MSKIRKGLVNFAVNRAYKLTDPKIYDDIHKRYEFRKQTILADNSLTEDETIEAIKMLNRNYTQSKISNDEGTKRICENCNQECLATLYCEYCVRNYLKAKFSNWTSGNNDIDKLIQQCQIEIYSPSRIVEWIPYADLQNIEYLTKGGFSEIYKAIWINGKYDKWDSEKQQLKRRKNRKVILKSLENVESANQSWFEEAKSHLTINNKHPNIIKCFGITQNPSNKNYMLVIRRADLDLRNYLQQNHNQLTWTKRISIILDIINALYFIHKENAIHRDLHSRNILYRQFNQKFSISDLGFCGPANKSPKSIYGNLPYIAPEVIVGKSTTFASDIYSIAMLMWEISSGRPPFFNYEHDYNLAINIINGIRPKIVPGTPLEYKNLMEQCWDANPLKRPDHKKLVRKIYNIYQNTQNESEANVNLEINKTSSLETKETNYTSSILSTSKVYQFENLPEPRNATEEEQEAFHSQPYDFDIPDNIDDFNKSSIQTFEDNDVNNLSKVFNEIQINSKDDVQNDYIGKETTPQQTQQQIKKLHFDTDGDDEIYNNSNFHSEQDEFEIPDDIN